MGRRYVLLKLEPGCTATHCLRAVLREIARDDPSQSRKKPEKAVAVGAAASNPSKNADSGPQHGSAEPHAPTKPRTSTANFF